MPGPCPFLPRPCHTAYNRSGSACACALPVLHIATTLPVSFTCHCLPYHTTILPYTSSFTFHTYLPGLHYPHTFPVTTPVPHFTMPLHLPTQFVFTCPPYTHSYLGPHTFVFTFATLHTTPHLHTLPAHCSTPHYHHYCYLPHIPLPCCLLLVYFICLPQLEVTFLPHLFAHLRATRFSRTLLRSDYYVYSCRLPRYQFYLRGLVYYAGWVLQPGLVLYTTPAYAPVLTGSTTTHLLLRTTRSACRFHHACCTAADCCRCGVLRSVQFITYTFLHTFIPTFTTWFCTYHAAHAPRTAHALFARYRLRYFAGSTPHLFTVASYPHACVPQPPSCRFVWFRFWLLPYLPVCCSCTLQFHHNGWFIVRHV